MSQEKKFLEVSTIFLAYTDETDYGLTLDFKKPFFGRANGELKPWGDYNQLKSKSISESILI